MVLAVAVLVGKVVVMVTALREGGLTEELLSLLFIAITELFSAFEQTHCAHDGCDAE